MFKDFFKRKKYKRPYLDTIVVVNDKDKEIPNEIEKADDIMVAENTKDKQEDNPLRIIASLDETIYKESIIENMNDSDDSLNLNECDDNKNDDVMASLEKIISEHRMIIPRDHTSTLAPHNSKIHEQEDMREDIEDSCDSDFNYDDKSLEYKNIEETGHSIPKSVFDCYQPCLKIQSFQQFYDETSRFFRACKLMKTIIINSLNNIDVDFFINKYQIEFYWDEPDTDAEEVEVRIIMNESIDSYVLEKIKDTLHFNNMHISIEDKNLVLSCKLMDIDMNHHLI